jgi:hypothetical protein
MTRLILTALLTVLALAVPANAAIIPNPETIAQHLYPTSPCNGHRTLILDPAVAANGNYEEAAINNTALHPLDCVIRVSPTLKASRHQRCIIYVHAAGHQAGLQDTPEGIMRSRPPLDYYEPCATLRERVTHQLENQRNVANVRCGKQTGRTYTCRTELLDGRIVRYRIRTRGENYAITRIR